MTGESLEWPWDYLSLDPYEADERAVKRTYASLLKSTRPDDDPEGFMRLREARDQALRELEWGWWLFRPEPADEENDADPLDSDVDDFFDDDELPTAAMFWVEDQRTNQAVGIGRVEVFYVDLEAVEAVVPPAFDQYAADPNSWRMDQTLELIQSLDDTLGECRRPESGGTYVAGVRAGWCLDLVSWFLRRLHRPQGADPSQDNEAFMGALHRHLDANTKRALPRPCMTPIEKYAIKPSSPEIATLIQTLADWREDRTGLARARFQAVLQEVASFFDDFELRGSDGARNPPEILFGCLAACLDAAADPDQETNVAAEAIEFATAAAAACDVPAPSWLTVPALNAAPYTSFCQEWMWRIVQDPGVLKALDRVSDRLPAWQKDGLDDHDIQTVLYPVARAQRASNRADLSSIADITFVERDCYLLEELLDSFFLIEYDESYAVRRLFQDKLGFLDEEDDVTAEETFENPVWASLHALLSADAPGSKAEWEALLDHPDVIDIDSAIDLERWLRERVLDLSGYWEDTVRPIPGIGAAQALLLKERFGWGDPKSMASWHSQERDAIMALFDITRRRHFGADGEPAEYRSQMPITEWGVRPAGTAEEVQESEEPKKGSRFWKYLTWFAVAALIAQLLKLFGVSSS